MIFGLDALFFELPSVAVRGVENLRNGRAVVMVAGPHSNYSLDSGGIKLILGGVLGFWGFGG